MTEPELKDFLDSFVDEPERNFVVVFSPRKTRRRHGSYSARLRRITIYPRISPQPIDVVGTGLHELAHHLAWERSADDLVSTSRVTKRFPAHGYIFKTVLSELLETFNARHADRFQGFLVLEKGEARYGPAFVEFANVISSMDTDYRAVMLVYTAIFGWRPKKSSAKHTPAPVPIADGAGAELPTMET